MNKKTILTALSIAFLIVMISLGVKKIVLRRSAHRLKTALIKRKDRFFEAAETYKRNQSFLKLKKCYKKIIENFPDLESISEVQKDLEDLNMKLLFSPIITEDSFEYEIKRSDTLGKIAARYGTTVELLQKSNNLKDDKIIPGRVLKVQKERFGLFCDKSRNFLFLKRGSEIVKTYTVSTGANNSTPVGKFKIEEKLVKPLWYKVGAVVNPDSSEYELGSRWMGISEPGYGIHGTKDPASIGKQVTKGCIRMRNEEVEELYSIVPQGTEVVIVD